VHEIRRITVSGIPNIVLHRKNTHNYMGHDVRIEPRNAIGNPTYHSQYMHLETWGRGQKRGETHP